MAGFWGSSAVLELGDRLINFENDDLPVLFPPSPDGPNNHGALPDSPGPLDLLVPRRNHSPTVIACPDPAPKNLFHAGVCRGITKEVILSNHRLSSATESENIANGFDHLVGNALRDQATCRSRNGGEWPFGPSVLGFLRGSANASPTWECVSLDDVIGFRIKGSCGISAPAGGSCCQWCRGVQSRLFRLCRKEVNDRADDAILLGRADQYLLRSPQLVERAMKKQSHTIHLLQKKATRNRDTIARLRATEEVIPNVNVDVLLGDEKQWKTDYAAMMIRETDVSKKEIFAILFQEMEVVRKRKLRDGNSRGHKWSPLMIQFSGYIRQGNGPSSGVNASTWDFMAQVLNLPTNRTLMKYTHTDTSTPDGLCFETAMQNAELVDKIDSNLESPLRYGKLSVDSHSVKERFCKCDGTSAPRPRAPLLTTPFTPLMPSTPLQRTTQIPMP
jgi:hypothetical protein